MSGLLFLVTSALLSQPDSLSILAPDINRDSLNLEQIKDSLWQSRQDTLINASDVITKSDNTADSTSINSKRRSSPGEQIKFQSNDSIHIDFKNNKIRLRGESQIETQGRTLQSEVITLDLNAKTMNAQGIENEEGNLIGFPRLLEDGDEYVGKEIRYNYNTNRGTISMGETAIGEGFYYGEKIKRVSDNEFFIQNGYYTTCDKGHPHYYFGAEEMKMVVGEEFLICPLTLYVEDMPVFTVPFGVFLPLESGRRSGLIVPTFDNSRRRGLVFRDFGFYWAASEYFDAQITADWFTKGGFLLKNRNRWALKDVFTGSVGLEYGLTRQNPDDENVENYRFTFNHSHEITPQDRFVADVNFSSQDFNRNTQFRIQNLTQQNIFSKAFYNHSFDGGSSFSVSFDRNQNIIDDSYSNNFPVTYNMPNQRVMRIADRDVNFSMSARGVFSERNDVIQRTIEEPDTNYTVDEFRYSNQKGITFNPSLTYSFPKIYNFTITPSIGFGGNVYFRKLNRSFDEATGETVDNFENGLYADAYWNASVRVQTRLFGVADDRQPFFGFIKPSSLGLKAFRHVLEPSVTFKYDPDFSTDAYSFYSTYRDQEGTEIKYYNFEADRIGTAPSSSLSQNLNWGLQNRFEAKIAGEEGKEDTNMELLQFNLSGSYNFTRDTFKHSDISATLRTPSLKYLNMNTTFTFSPYEQVREYNEDRDQFVWRDIDQYRISNGGFLRMERFTLTLSTSLSDQGLNYDPNNDPLNPEVPEDTLDTRQLGVRFSKSGTQGRSPNYYGDSLPGHTPFNLPWALTLNLNYTVNTPNPDLVTQTLTMNPGLNFTLAETWQFRASTNYDLITGELKAPQVSVNKDLHCWELSFNWVPTGPNAQFWLRFGIKSSQLSDLFLEKRNNRQLR